MVNVIDGGSESFLRAEAATFATSFDHVAVLRGPALLDGAIGNSVILAGDHPLDRDAWRAAMIATGDEGDLVADVEAYVGDALVLTDDFAPVDQLILGAR